MPHLSPVMMIMMAIVAAIEFACSLKWGASGVWKGAALTAGLLLLFLIAVTLWFVPTETPGQFRFGLGMLFAISPIIGLGWLIGWASGALAGLGGRFLLGEWRR